MKRDKTIDYYFEVFILDKELIFSLLGYIFLFG